MLPQERHPYKPFFIPLRLDVRLGVCGHKSAKTSALFHPHGIQLPLQPIDLAGNSTVVVASRAITAYLCLQ